MRTALLLALCVAAARAGAGCTCTADSNPVICADGETYTNPCEASCAGQTSCASAKADCVCTTEYAPVTCDDGLTYSNTCVAACASGTNCATDDEAHAAEVAAHLAQAEEAAAHAAQEAAAQQAHEEAAAAAQREMEVAQAVEWDRQRGDNYQVLSGTNGTSTPFNAAGRPLVVAHNDEHPVPAYGDVSKFHCQAITGRRTDAEGVLHIGTALNPLSETHQQCDGTPGQTAAVEGEHGRVPVCCPASCGSCNDSEENCAAEGGSLCCARQVVAANRMCSPLVSAPCQLGGSIDRSIRVESMYADAFADATQICFHAYGFYCQRVTGKLSNPDYLNLNTPLNSNLYDAIRLPADAPFVAEMQDVVRVCFVPDPLPSSQQHLIGKHMRHRQDWDDPVVTKWREQYGLVHPQQGTGYAYENAERWNTWPAYKPFLPESGCCKTCTTGKPCGQSCIAADLTCHKEPGVHEWCACDKETADKLQFMKDHPRNVGKPVDYQGWPYTYPEGYHKDVHPHIASTWQDFDTYKSGDTTNEFDKRGRMKPKQNVDYSPSTSKACCRMACASQYAGQHGDAEQMKDCVLGCGLWVATSSLNYESEDWWPKLEQKCNNDCVNIAVAKSTAPDDVHGYFNKLRTPADENTCQQGCGLFHTCMVNGGDSQAAAGDAAVTTVSEAQAAVHTDTNMCPAGWGILSPLNPLQPHEPRACCHYSCGKCVLNCNGEHFATQGLYNDDTSRSDTLRKNRCCVSRIKQSGLFCDSHKAPCLVPPSADTSL